MIRHRLASALLLASLGYLLLQPLLADAVEPVAIPGTSPVAVTLPGGGSALLKASQELEFTDTARSRVLAEEATAQARQTGDAKGLLAALLQAGKTARFLNDYPAALKAANEGLALAAETKNEDLRGHFLFLLGYVKWNQADLPAALTALFAADGVGRTVGDTSLQIAVQSALGAVYARDDNPQVSLAHNEEACALAERTNDPLLASVLNNLGNHYMDLKDYPRSRELYERSLLLARPTGNFRLIAFLLVNLGQVAVETGDAENARSYLAEALALSRQYGIRRGEADVWYLLGSLERMQGHLPLSREDLDRSLAIAQNLKNPDLFATIYTEYVATEEASGRYREALDYERKLADQREIIRGEKSRQQTARLTAQYDAERRAQQIKLLERDRELDQTALALKRTELSRAHTRYSALALVLVLGGLAASAFASRQRARARYANLALAETRAAKEQVEVADANKARLLTIAHRSLQESEARFRNAFELSPLGIALVGLDGKWIRVNPALCQITGYTEAELLACNFQSITHPDDLDLDLGYVAQILRGELETYQMEKRYLHKDGHFVWIRLDVSLIREPGTHEPCTFISQIQDITARRRDEEQLYHAKEEAERANAAKSEFLSRMSHELRTPLNAILGFGQLLEIEDLGAPANQSVGQILVASRHLLGLINEVLDISTIESGSFALCLEPTGVPEAVREVIDLVRPLAAQADVRLSSTVAEDGLILADHRRLRQVLLNLLSNAIKYNRRGGEVAVTCGLAAERVFIEVADTGPGIAAEDLDTIFVPFSRLPATLAVTGTGLGLSLSRVLTEAMQGSLGVRSVVGEGSTFRAEFARLAAGAAAEVPRLALDPVCAALFEPELPREATVLYIEDNATNIELVSSFLADQRKLRLLTAANGRTGLAMAVEHRPDLVLLDVHLPDLPSSEVLRRLRSHSALADLPVIVISADASAQQAGQMSALGICEYLTKPIDLRDLRRAIGGALGTCPAHQER